jgi:hypothetical protein
VHGNIRRYRPPIRHVKVEPRPDFMSPTPVTVCIAALSSWNYAKPGDPEDWGLVAITASDRMITFGDVQYEPEQMKFASMATHTMLLISGDYSLHSEAIKTTQHALQSRPDATPGDIALMYGRAMQAIKQRHAEDIFLAPLGLNTDLLAAQQNELSPSTVDRLLAQMQQYEGEVVEALIVGIEKKVGTETGGGTIYHVDSRGSVTCADDVGFAAIGSGAWHANSQLMQAGYTRRFPYFRALATVFAAKKAADVSPGVGNNFTDVSVIFRTGPEPLIQYQRDKLEEIYADFVTKRAALATDAVTALTDCVIERGKAGKNEQSEGQPGKDTQADVSPSADAPEATAGNEAPKKRADTQIKASKPRVSAKPKSA